MPRISHTQQVAALLFHARAATPFPAAGGELCASVPSGLDSRRLLPLRSAEFRDWLTANYYNEYESAPSPGAFRSVLHTLEARAQYGDWPAQKIDNRLSFEGDPFAPSKVVLNLAGVGGENVEIDSAGWRLVTNLRHSFREFSTTLPLPAPELPADPQLCLDTLAQLFRLTPSNQVRILTWIAAALRPLGPYPILVLTGPAASGKSVFAQALRSLLDPSSVPLRRMPDRDRELPHIALENWFLVFDFVRRIPNRISEALCALSSGDALAIDPRDYRNAGASLIARPIILIVPQDETQHAWTPPRTLATRTLKVDLAPISAPLPESAIWTELEALRRPLLGALCSAVATALQRIRSVDLAHIPRFADCALWAAAAAPALGLEVAAILEMLADPGSMWAGTDPVKDAIYALVARDAEWKGDAAALLSQLRALLPYASLPSSPKGLSQLLSRYPELHVTRTRAAQGRRTLSMVRISSGSEPATTNASVIS